MSNQKEIFTSKCRVTLLEPNILENKILDNCIIEVEDVLEIKEINKHLTAGSHYAALLCFGTMTEVTQEARELMASKEFQQKAVAKALLVNNVGHRLLGNFYLAVNKPHTKTKLFTVREIALNWLRQELKNAPD
jgi:hypothetical protein